MELIFKRKFLREAKKLGNKELARHLKIIFLKIETSKSLYEIGGLVKLRNYSNYYRIRINLSPKKRLSLGFNDSQE